MILRLYKQFNLDISDKVAIGGIVLAGLVISLALKTMKHKNEATISKTG